ncbi:hypothetical protein EDD29_3829 [Actinocorallia herbida]|uniref:Uncharacterized protein n=1 Tax=Actinocorallia herbida TaxID=58109 RepID=A0A3N1CYF6_9ACTN|nr:hypothetical protein [Actinocorallia herbida]ROO86266.1 hypothetical protein EDD29_3829 [Actinocorallia herbida]
MAYELRAVLASGDVLSGRAEAPGTLGQGLALLPVTDRLRDAFGGAAALGFWDLPDGLAAELARWSIDGPVAYVEAEYFGGTGAQRAVVWQAGRLEWGPVHVAEGERFPVEGSPISQALRRLGAVRGTEFDEFAAVGLGRHRWTSGWIGADPVEGA